MIRIAYLIVMCIIIRCIKTIQNITENSGHKYFSAFLIAVDTTFFLFVFRDIIINELTPSVVLAVASGYMIGSLLGTFLEDKIALGKVYINIKIDKENSPRLAKILRENGFVFIESKRFYSHTGRLKKIHQGIIYRRELPRLKKITKNLSIIATVAPLKSTFGMKPIKAKEYLEIEGKSDFNMSLVESGNNNEKDRLAGHGKS